MSPPGQRTRRMNAALREVVAEALGGLSDPRVGFVTITHVEAAPDTTSAKVYFTSLNPDDRASSLAGLESARGVLQGRVAGALRTKHTPLLHFVYDEQSERAERLTRLIDEVAAPDPPE